MREMGFEIPNILVGRLFIRAYVRKESGRPTEPLLVVMGNRLDECMMRSEIFTISVERRFSLLSLEENGL